MPMKLCEKVYCQKNVERMNYGFYTNNKLCHVWRCWVPHEKKGYTPQFIVNTHVR